MSRTLADLRSSLRFVRELAFCAGVKQRIARRGVRTLTAELALCTNPADRRIVGEMLHDLSKQRRGLTEQRFKLRTRRRELRAQIEHERSTILE